MTEKQRATYIERAERDELDLASWEPVPVVRDGSVRVEPRAINISLPDWLVRSLDGEAGRRNVTRKDLINTILVKAADAHYSFA